jgi:hypothetical protein
MKNVLRRVEKHTKDCSISNLPGGQTDCTTCNKWHSMIKLREHYRRKLIGYMAQKFPSAAPPGVPPQVFAGPIDTLNASSASMPSVAAKPLPPSGAPALSLEVSSGNLAMQFRSSDYTRANSIDPLAVAVPSGDADAAASKPPRGKPSAKGKKPLKGGEGWAPAGHQLDAIQQQLPSPIVGGMGSSMDLVKKLGGASSGGLDDFMLSVESEMNQRDSRLFGGQGNGRELKRPHPAESWQPDWMQACLAALSVHTAKATRYPATHSCAPHAFRFADAGARFYKHRGWQRAA